MITPRTTRLWRAPDLRAFQRTIIDLLPESSSEAAACAVIVPSRSAAEELRRTIQRIVPTTAPALPDTIDVVTRDDFYASLRQRVRGVPPALGGFEREVLLRRCANAASAAGAEPPFNIRAALVARILALYDELRRCHRTVADFERLLTSALEPGADYDRGAARLLQQTRFLVETLTRFESAVDATGRIDEHGLRDVVLAAEDATYRHVIVTVAHQAMDPAGLWTADFDLLARLPALERLDVVATDGLLDAGFLERVHDLLPGIEERRGAAASIAPVLLLPAHSAIEGGTSFHLCRDREEELAEVVRSLDGEVEQASLDRMAVVFQRPLPYLYLAPQVFADAGVPWQALDALPLAAEPFAAAIDLVFSAAAANYTRGALVALLRCPHLRYTAGDQELDGAAVAALDRALVARKYLGGVERLASLAAEGSLALQAAAAVAHELESALGATSASAQIDGVLAFIDCRERLPEADDPWYERHMRARGAVLSALHMLRQAHAAHDDRPLTVAELSGAVRRWIEGQTFSLRRGSNGIVLLDARAACYADFDAVRIVGLTEADWPDRADRNIFYPQSLLAQLGWPSELDRVRTARVRFQELLRLPHERISLSTISLEDDGLVSPSTLLEDVAAVGLSGVIDGPRTTRSPLFAHESLSSSDPVDVRVASGAAVEWLAMRIGRAADDARFRGSAGQRSPSTYAVSRVEKYLDCPFRYFAAYVLRLPEERDEEGWMTPLERGVLVHQVFEEFFAEWQRSGRGAITAPNLNEAIASFAVIGERHLEDLPEGDRALERTFLLGSAAAAGLAERAFAFEIEQASEVRERLLEYELEGTFSFESSGEPHTIAIRSKADRIDLLADGTLRVIDYKLGRPPDRKRALQLPIYGVAAQQALAGRHGRSWTVSRAGYVAFKHKGAFADIGHDLGKAMASGQERLVTAVGGIERGEFPPRPEEPFLCNWCPYPSVCRKDYVGDE